MNKAQAVIKRLHPNEEIPKFSFSKLGFFSFSHENEIIILPKEEILYARSDSNYTRLQCVSGKFYLLCKTLKEVVKGLDNRFVRIHNSYVVNMLQVRKYSKTQRQLQLATGELIPVAKRQMAYVNSLFN